MTAQQATAPSSDTSPKHVADALSLDLAQESVSFSEMILPSLDSHLPAASSKRQRSCDSRTLAEVQGPVQDSKQQTVGHSDAEIPGFLNHSKAGLSCSI